MNDMWWLNWNTFGALLACIAVVAVPLIIRRFLQKRQDAENTDRLAEATRCESCGTEDAPLGTLAFSAFEGWFVSAWKHIHVSSVVCANCAHEIVTHCRKRALKTCWRCFQAPFVVLLTFTNSRAALKKHAKSLKEKPANKQIHPIAGKPGSG